MVGVSECSIHAYMLLSIRIALRTCAAQCITTLKHVCMAFIQTKHEPPTIALFIICLNIPFTPPRVVTSLQRTSYASWV